LSLPRQPVATGLGYGAVIVVRSPAVDRRRHYMAKNPGVQGGKFPTVKVFSVFSVNCQRLSADSK
jgi:hypothetical protein